MKPRNFVTGMAAAAAALGMASAVSAQDMSDAAAERLAQFERTGETRTCVNLTQVRSIQPLDDSHFLIEMRNRDTYLNVVNGRCSRAASSSTYLQYSITGSQLCRGEIVNVIDNGGQGMLSGSCSLGGFERLTQAGEGDSASR
ncbi:DUF6491 family protein [Glycocaulis alkaliphilus]|nr:DUF6491 family protein [Glycocaulis alkaliphilus]GGB74786.1 hypothetical protein GCM10007417_13230 [Glycocaulis alkaliphilus]